MDIAGILIAILYLSILVLFLESGIVFHKWKGKLHAYLLFSCVATLVNNTGYLLEITSKSEDSYITALQFSYAGRVWIAFSLFLFAAELSRFHVPDFLKKILALTHVGTYAAILNVRSSRLYYSELDGIVEGVFPKLLHKNGILHHFYMAQVCAYILFGTSLLLLRYWKEKNEAARRRLFVVILAIVTESACFLVQISGMLEFTEYFDITILGYTAGAVIMFIAILNYNLLGAKDIAREYMVDRLSEGIIAANCEGAVQYINEPAKRLYPDVERGGCLVPAEIKEAIKDGENLYIDGRIFAPEVKDLQYEGEDFGKIYALVDETDHVRYMEELQEQREIADQANEAKSKFLANMSHEIRTPINAVLGMDEMILRESREREVRAYAADIMSAGKTLLSLINDILDLSKVEEGKMEIIPVQYALSSLVNDLLNMIRDRAAKKGLAFHVNVCEQIPHLLCGDEIRIRQCVLNLLTNAVKYTEKGSVTLDVTFEKKDEGHIRLGFSVEDTGIGMKPEDLEKLCAPYQRIEEKRNRSIEGTGLGMSITKALLDLMGSCLKVHSEYGKGTSISFVVEQEVVKWDEIGDYAKRFQEMKAESFTYQELFHAPDARILVVDDTEMNLKVIQSLLKKTQVQIDTALSGKDALALAGQNAYDVVFIDHMMPDMDGIETLQHLRGMEGYEETPAVALTANAVSGAREMYLGAGFTDYLAKPVEGAKLEKMMVDLLPAEKCRKPDPGEAAERVDLQEDAPKAGGSAEGAEEGLPDWMKGFPDLDWEAGKRNCGSAEGYMEALSVFYQTAAKKAEEIERMYQEDDIRNYTIKVHALKSSAKIIGAEELSSLAKKLEAAGDGGDRAFIRSETGRLLSMYRSLYQKLDQELNASDGSDEDLPEIAQKDLEDAYRAIIEVAQGMDYDLMEAVMQGLRGYRFPEVERERMKTLERLFAELEWEDMQKTAEQGLG